MLSCIPCLLLAAVPAQDTGAPAEKPRSRSFLFTYSATVTNLAPGKTARIWLPVPPSNDDQWVKVESIQPADATIHHDAKNDNYYLYVEAKANAEGKVPVSATYRVTRWEVRGPTETLVNDLTRVKRFLEPDAVVPIDGKPLELIKDKKLPDDPMAKAKELYEIVNNHMKYDKPADKPWGRGDSVYACESGVGNCTDFHSLFISLARSQKIPAKFEIGFSIPETRGKGDIAGYHCWAKFRPNDSGWVGVDISEANKNPKMKDYYFGNLTEDRVTFTKGRDLVLVPAQKGKPLNFLIYPYVEVDDAIYDAKKIEKKFAYEDAAR